MDIKALRKKLKETLEAAKAAVMAGNLEDAEKFKGEATTIKAQIQAFEEIDAELKSANTVDVNIPLPGAAPDTAAKPTGEDEDDDPFKRAGSFLIDARPKAIMPSDDAVASSYAKAVYQTQFNEPAAAVKAVINDMYGRNYEWMRMAQWKAFLAYMRMKESHLDAKHMQLLHSIILTPELVAKAITEGWDISHLKSTMVEASDTLGGYIVPVDFQTRVLERLPGQTVMRGRAQMETTGRDVMQFPVATGGDTQYTSAIRETWVDETPVSTASETNLTFGMESLPIHTAMAVVPLSKNLLEDAAFNLANYLIRKFSEAAAINEDNSFLIGTGAGKPQGVLPGSSNGNSLTTANSGAAAALTFDGLILLMFSIASQYRQRAVWVAKRDTYRQIAQLKDGAGNYLWTELRGNNVTTGIPNTLRGFPVLEQESMPSVAASAFPVLFGDLQGYMIGDRVGMSVQRYDVNPGENIVKYETRRRLGGQTVEGYRLAVQQVAA